MRVSIILHSSNVPSTHIKCCYRQESRTRAISALQAMFFTTSYTRRIFADYSYYTKAYSGVTSFNTLKDEVEMPVHLLKLMAGEI